MKLFEWYKRKMAHRRLIKAIKKIGTTPIYFVVSTSVPDNCIYSYTLSKAENREFRKLVVTSSDFNMSFNTRVKERKVKDVRKK